MNFKVNGKKYLSIMKIFQLLKLIGVSYILLSKLIYQLWLFEAKMSYSMRLVRAKTN